MDSPFRDLVSFDDAVELLKDITNKNTLRHYVQMRKITHVKMFGRVYFRLSDLVAYYEAGVVPAKYPDKRQGVRRTYADDLADMASE